MERERPGRRGVDPAVGEHRQRHGVDRHRQSRRPRPARRAHLRAQCRRPDGRATGARRSGTGGAGGSTGRSCASKTAGRSGCASDARVGDQSASRRCAAPRPRAAAAVQYDARRRDCRFPRRLTTPQLLPDRLVSLVRGTVRRVRHAVAGAADGGDAAALLGRQPRDADGLGSAWASSCSTASSRRWARAASCRRLPRRSPHPCCSP